MGCSAPGLGEALAVSEPQSGRERGREGLCKAGARGQAGPEPYQVGPHRRGTAVATSPLVLAAGRSELDSLLPQQPSSP